MAAHPSSSRGTPSSALYWSELSDLLSSPFSCSSIPITSVHQLPHLRKIQKYQKYFTTKKFAWPWLVKLFIFPFIMLRITGVLDCCFVHSDGPFNLFGAFIWVLKCTGSLLATQIHYKNVINKNKCVFFLSFHTSRSMFSFTTYVFPSEWVSEWAHECVSSV